MSTSIVGCCASPPAVSRLNRLTDLCFTVISASFIALSIMGYTSARSNGRRVKLCNEVHNSCYNRDGCKYALENYFFHCLDVTEEETFQCTEQCKMALTMLLSSDEHDGPNAFRDCDCQGDEFCRRQKQRIATCQDDVQLWLDAIKEPNTHVSCTLAAMVCSADTACLTAIEYYREHCKRIFDVNNPRCTARCNNSLSILYRQEKAQKLRTCRCDGTENYNCTAVKDNTQSLCFGIDSRGRETTTVRIRHPGSHDHTRPPSGSHPSHTNTVDDSIEKNVPPMGSSSRNSAYTIHSNAGAPLWINYQCSLHMTLTVFILLLLVFAR